MPDHRYLLAWDQSLLRPEILTCRITQESDAITDVIRHSESRLFKYAAFRKTTLRVAFKAMPPIVGDKC
jgi:hypothetical protein